MSNFREALPVPVSCIDSLSLDKISDYDTKAHEDKKKFNNIGVPQFYFYFKDLCLLFPLCLGPCICCSASNLAVVVCALIVTS